MPRDAAYFRAHREAFTLAIELGCTPKEAAEELATRQARERWRATQDRLDRRTSNGPPPPSAAPGPADRWDAQWMYRD